MGMQFILTKIPEGVEVVYKQDFTTCIDGLWFNRYNPTDAPTVHWMDCKNQLVLNGLLQWAKEHGLVEGQHYRISY